MNEGNGGKERATADVTDQSAVAGPFRSPVDPAHGLEDGRKPWEWQSKYPKEAHDRMKGEALLTIGYFVFFLVLTCVAAGYGSGTPSPEISSGSFNFSPKLLLMFAAGGMGGTTFSIKWLMHSAATGKWHLDRFFWRAFVPLTGGVYAVVVLHLMAGGMIGAGEADRHGYSRSVSILNRLLFGRCERPAVERSKRCLRYSRKEVTSAVLQSSQAPLLTWSELEAPSLEFGPKGTRLLALPRSWTLPFALLSHRLTQNIVDGVSDQSGILQHIENLATFTGRVIVRSSVIGETIWERGTFLSEVLPEGANWSEFISTLSRVAASAPNRKMAIVLQAYVDAQEQGEFGNLLRLSKTRDHWESSTRGRDGVTSSERFNSQRSTAPSDTNPLEARKGVTRSKLFASVAAWSNNNLLRGVPDRVSYEWVRTGSRFYLVQLDREDEDSSGVNPLQVYVEASVGTGTGGRFLRRAEVADRKKWDKLAVLDELYESDSPMVPSLYILDSNSCNDGNREVLTREFISALQKNIVIRTSVRAGHEKLTNLKKSDCLTAEEATEWAIFQAESLAREYPDAELAFVAHRYIGARASAWVRASPESPVVEVHGTWGLPDALQFCPYDIWEVHVPTEEVTEYPAYKSNVLLLNNDGSWRYERVKNEIARFQSMTRQEVLDVATRTAAISAKLRKSVHVMWFVGCRASDDHEASMPWYWTGAHAVDLPEKRTAHLFDVTDRQSLASVPNLANRYRDLSIRLIPRSGELLRDNDFLRSVADTVVPLGIPVILTGSTLAHAFFQLAKHGCTVIPAGEKEHVRPRKQTTFGKLVRDRIPERIASQKEKQSVSTIPVQYRFAYLVGKLVEEAFEVRDAAAGAERLVELADVYEVVRAIAALDGEEIEAVAAAANKKRAKSGGFDDGHLLLETSLPTVSDLQLATEGAGGSPSIHLKDERRVSVPLAAFGFMEEGQQVSVRVDAVGIVMRFTVRKDSVEIEIAPTEQQLELEL